jgi:hypothetical protein
MCARLRFPVLVVALLAVPLAASAQGTPRGKGGGRAAHPKVNAAEACEECHSQATPAAFREWQQGTHGINLVKCFVCHGSTGADFKRKPVADRCIGCHADQVASMSGAAMKGKDCFSCHTAHALNPHAMGPATTAAAVLGADKLAPMVTVEGKMPPPAPPAAAGAAQPGSAAPAAQPGAAPAAPGSASPQPGAPAPAGPGAEKDVKHSQPHPPTDR